MRCETSRVCLLPDINDANNNVKTSQWHLCDHSTLQHYNDTLDYLLVNIKCFDRISANDSYDSVKIKLDSFYCDTVTCIKRAIDTCIPLRNSNTFNHNIPGWNTHVREKHDAAREAFLLCIDNGRSRQGSICDEMRKTRAHFKLALRFCRQHIEQMKAEACADAVYDKDSRQFWNTVQRISKSKATSLINSINNVSGEQNVADMWMEHFRKLYYSCSNTNHRDIFYAMGKCDKHVNNVANLHAVSVYEVVAAMSELQTGKAVRPDGIPAEAFVYGGHRLAVLCCFFNMCLDYCYLPSAFTSSVIVPIIKNKAAWPVI